MPSLARPPPSHLAYFRTADCAALEGLLRKMKTQQPCAMQSIVAHISGSVFLVEGLVEGTFQAWFISLQDLWANALLEPSDDSVWDTNLAASIGALL
jgi:hypothetical protein